MYSFWHCVTLAKVNTRNNLLQDSRFDCNDMIWSQRDFLMIHNELVKRSFLSLDVCLIMESICMCWIDFQFFFFFFFFCLLVVAYFFCFKVGYTQCLAIATGNFFFFGFILVCCNLIALETKLLCLLGVIICDIKNKIRNNRQVPTYFMDLCSLQVFFFFLFFYFFIFYG